MILGGPVAVSADVKAAAQHEITTNQAFVVDGGDQQFVQGEAVTFNVSGITTDNVDVALIPCENVTDTDGTITFTDADATADQADLVGQEEAAAEADIVSINGVTGAFGDFEDNVIVTDGTLTVTTDQTAEGCFVLVVFDDPTDDDVLNLDANDAPLADELFGVSGDVLIVNPAAVNATPEFELNRFGDTHTVTAQLTNGGDPETDVAVADIAVRFTLIEVAGVTPPADGDIDGTTAGECSQAERDAGTVVDIENLTTDQAGTASFSFTDQDPNTAADSADTSFCVVVEADLDPNTAGFEAQDVVAKEFTDDAATAQNLSLTPEQDTNAPNESHTVTATLTDQFGQPVEGPVTFEVFRNGATTATFTTVRNTTNGVATFTYSAPGAEADDIIVACIEDTTTTTDTDTSCGVIAADADSSPDEPNDTATKFFVVDQTAAMTTAEDSCLIGFDNDANQVDVEDATTDDNLRFVQDGNDQFFVNGDAVDQATFEAALSEGDRIAVDFVPEDANTAGGEVSTFTLRNDTNCTLDGGETSTGGGTQTGATAMDATFTDEATDADNVFADDIGDEITVTYDNPILVENGDSITISAGGDTVTYICGVDSDGDLTADITCTGNNTNVLTVTLTDNAAGRTDLVIDNTDDFVTETSGVTDVAGNADGGFPEPIDAGV